MIDLLDIKFHEKEINNCVDESMDKISKLEKGVQSESVLKEIREEKMAVDMLLKWVDKH